MPQVSVYNHEGKTLETLEVSAKVFGVPVKEQVVAEAVFAQQAEHRVARAHTKTRGEVRGGGKKPWKQKGTGRARQGSIRSPQWRGGGIIFGPLKERVFAVKINKKVRQAALRMVLSDKVLSERLIVIDALPAEGKTKQMVAVRKALPGAGKKAMVVLNQKTDAVIRALSNVPRTDVMGARNLNVRDVLQHEYLIVEKSAISVIESLYA
ncbi:MAG: 50S ribosomal protein L4 [Candidatus Magasanikbacteria bacterium]|nr:50S ribosomal protein L4 [Candidatus Magasanikbacteria bacterium]